LPSLQTRAILLFGLASEVRVMASDDTARRQDLLDRNVKVEPVCRKNVGVAIDIAATGFPGELREVAQSFFSSLEPDRNKWNLPGASETLALEYLLFSIDGAPFGVTGIYSLVAHPRDAWYGWVALDPRFRGMGLGQHLITAVEALAPRRSYEVLRAWSVDIPRFGAMHRKFLENRYSKETIDTSSHGAGRYVVFSKSLGPALTDCPRAATMSGGSVAVKIDEVRVAHLLESMTCYCCKRKVARGWGGRVPSGENLVEIHDPVAAVPRLIRERAEAASGLADGRGPPQIRLMAAVLQEAGGALRAPDGATVGDLLPLYEEALSAAEVA
jgi:GNAT superfamily N-acetyltransferase